MSRLHGHRYYRTDGSQGRRNATGNLKYNDYSTYNKNFATFYNVTTGSNESETVFNVRRPIHTHTHTCTHTHIHIHTHRHTHARVNKHTKTHVHVSMHMQIALARRSVLS